MAMQYACVGVTRYRLEDSLLTQLAQDWLTRHLKNERCIVMHVYELTSASF